MASSALALAVLIPETCAAQPPVAIVTVGAAYDALPYARQVVAILPGLEPGSVLAGELVRCVSRGAEVTVVLDGPGHVADVVDPPRRVPRALALRSANSLRRQPSRVVGREPRPLTRDERPKEQRSRSGIAVRDTALADELRANFDARWSPARPLEGYPSVDPERCAFGAQAERRAGRSTPTCN